MINAENEWSEHLKCSKILDAVGKPMYNISDIDNALSEAEGSVLTETASDAICDIKLPEAPKVKVEAPKAGFLETIAWKNIWMQRRCETIKEFLK